MPSQRAGTKVQILHKMGMLVGWLTEDQNAAGGQPALRRGVRVGRRHPGQAIIELALILPIILVLLIGSVDLGRLFYFDVTVRNAVREGARRAIDVTRTTTEVESAVSAAAPGITLTNVTVSPATRTSSTTGAVTVSATYTFTPWTPGISALVGNSLAVTRSGVMHIL